MYLYDNEIYVEIIEIDEEQGIAFVEGETFVSWVRLSDLEKVEN